MVAIDGRFVGAKAAQESLMTMFAFVDEESAIKHLRDFEASFLVLETGLLFELGVGIGSRE